MSVVAINHLGQTRTFKQIQWDLLGRNKGNWTEVSAQQIVSEPTTGDKKAEVVNAVINEEKEITPPEQIISEEQQAKFINAGFGITKGSLKDFLDKAGVEYDNTLKTADLLKLVGASLKYNIETLNKTF